MSDVVYVDHMCEEDYYFSYCFECVSVNNASWCCLYSGTKSDHLWTELSNTPEMS